MPLRPPNECYSFPLFSFFFWENEATCLLPKTYTLRLFCCKICLPAGSLTYDQASLALPFHFTRCRVKHTRKEMQHAVVGSIYSKFRVCAFAGFLRSPLKSGSLQRCARVRFTRCKYACFYWDTHVSVIAEEARASGSWQFRRAAFFSLLCCLLCVWGLTHICVSPHLWP